MKPIRGISPTDPSRQIEPTSFHYIPEENLNNSLSFARKKAHFYIATKISESPIENSKLKIKIPTNSRKIIKEEENEDDFQKLSKEESKNIFKLTKNYNEDFYNELNVGPRYNHQGKLIPYSILGKTEIFLRQLNNNKPAGLFQIGEDKTPNSGHALKFDGLKRQVTNSRRNSFKSLGSDKTKDGVQTKAKTIKINKEQLLKEIDQFENKFKNIKKEDEDKLKQLQFVDQMLITKEKRILEKFENEQNQWRKDIERFCKSSDKTLNETVMLQYDQFRKNKEKIEEIENLKETLNKKMHIPDEQNDLYWYFSLRNYPEKALSLPKFAHHDKCKNLDHQEGLEFKKIAKFTLMQDLPNGFKTGIMNNADIYSMKNKNFEKIREPIVAKIKGTNASLINSSLRSNCINVINKKIDMNASQNALENYKGNLSNLLETCAKNITFEEDEIEEMEVTGRSVLEIEKEALLKDGNPNFQIYVKTKVEDHEKDEVIEENYDYKNMAKKGKLIFSQFYLNNKSNT